MKWKLFIVLLVGFLVVKSEQQTATIYFYDFESNVVDSASVNVSELFIEQQADITNPILKLIQKKQRNNQRIISAALAFPFPFGIVGLHRIFLGTKPHVPVAYIATFGGIFGLLPLIDFFVIILDKNLERYQQNGQVFMWIKE